MNFGFLLFPDLEELDLVGPWEMVAMWSQYADGPEKCLMIAETKEPVRCSNGMVIQPHVSLKAAISGHLPGCRPELIWHWSLSSMRPETRLPAVSSLLPSTIHREKITGPFTKIPMRPAT